MVDVDGLGKDMAITNVLEGEAFDKRAENECVVGGMGERCQEEVL